MSESNAALGRAAESRPRVVQQVPREVPTAPRNLAWLAGPLGALLLRPWCDRLILRLLTGSYFPTSRAWASAALPQATPEGLREEFPDLDYSGTRLARILDEIGGLREEYERAEAVWHDGLFGGAPPSNAGRLERARAHAAHEFHLRRRRFYDARRRLPPVRSEVATPAEAQARFGPGGADRGLGGRRDELPPVSVSHPLDRGVQRTRWISFASPGMDDRAWARVREPIGVARPPTLILLHGIGVEREMWRQGSLGTGHLLGAGARVILPEAPWHGRRRLPGWYGGEPVLGRGVTGLVELISSWAREIEVLANWARETGSPRVVIAGISMGALTAQLAAIEAAGWVPEARPDGLALVAGSGDLARTLQSSELLDELGVPRALAEAGWQEEDFVPWAERLFPNRPPALPPERILAVLGRPDRVISYRDGLESVRRFGLPPENVLVRDRGHFTLSLWMEHDRELIRRLLGLLFDRG